MRDHSDSKSGDEGSRISRRNYLKVGAASAAVGASALGAVGSGTADAQSTTTRGITFSKVLHAVDDLGMDPTGQQPIDDDFVVDDDTLIVFPSGTFRAGKHVYIGSNAVTNYGWKAADGAEPVIVPSTDTGGSAGRLRWWHRGGGNYLLEGLTFDYTKSGYGGMICMGAQTGRFVCKDVTIKGPMPDGCALAFRFQGASGTTGIVENVKLEDGIESGAGNCMGMFVPQEHAGEVTIRDCTVAKFNNNGLYASGPGGPSGNGGHTHVEGGEFCNNNVSNVRLGTDESYAKNVSVVVDRATTYGSYGVDARGIWCWYESPTIEGCDLTHTGDSSGDAPITVSHGGSPTVTDTRIKLDSDGYQAGVLLTESADNGSSFDSVSVTGSMSGKDAVLDESAGGTDYSNCCIYMPKSGQDGIRLTGGGGYSVTDTNINVDGQAIVFDSANGQTQNITHDETCPVADTSGSGGSKSMSGGGGSSSGSGGSTSTTTSSGSGSGNSGTTTRNRAPKAAFSASTDGLTLSVDGSNSTDSDGKLTSYEWSFDGSTAAGRTASHTFAKGGTYTVALTVTDDAGATDTAKKQVSVAAKNRGPTATFDVSVDGLTVRLDGRGSSDPDGTVASYEWGIGGERYSGAMATHTFWRAGDHDVTLTVTDNDGATDQVTRTVHVDPALPHVIRIEGHDEDTCGYRIRVSGNIEPAGNGTIEPSDEVHDGYVAGSVHGDTDAYRFSGGLRRFTVDGTARIVYDG